MHIEGSEKNSPNGSDFNSEDFAAATQSIARLATVADIVVPGHDNYFLVKR